MNKTLNVDWDDPSDLKKMIKTLQSRRNKVLESYGYTAITFNGNSYNFDSLLPAFERMLAKDFSYLYDNSDNSRNSYVYFHCDPTIKLNVKSNIKHFLLASKYPNVDCLPFYVGKGCGNRAFDLNRNDTHRKIRRKITLLGEEVKSVIIKSNISSTEALNLEANLIDVLGLKTYSKHGLLCNLDEGVESKTRHSSYKPNSPEQRILLRNGFII